MPKPQRHPVRPDTSGAAIHIGDEKLLGKINMPPVQLPKTQSQPSTNRSKVSPPKKGDAEKTTVATQDLTTPPRDVAGDTSAKKVTEKPTAKKEETAQGPRVWLHIPEKYRDEIALHINRIGVSEADVIKLVATELRQIETFSPPEKEYVKPRYEERGVVVRFKVPTKYIEAYERKFNPIGIKPSVFPYYAWAAQHEDAVYRKILDKLKAT